MERLIHQGLHRQNLLELISISETLIADRPAIYGSLLAMFRLLEREYEELDAIPTSRYLAVNSALQTPLLNLLQAETQSAGAILRCLDAANLAFEGLSH